MKKYILSTICIICIIQELYSRQIIALNQGKKILTAEESRKPNPENHDQFVFSIYETNEIPKGEVEPHFLGNEIACKWTLINELYQKKGEIIIGFGNSYIETIKPSVFNAVCRMNNYYKNGIKKGKINKEEAKKEYSWILDCALAIYQCDETLKFESALVKVKDPEKIIQLFNSVRIDKI